MASLDLISTYFPAPAELTPEELQAGRERIVSYLRQSQPDLDMRPDSVFGNLFLSPATTLIVSLEAAMGRFLSDLDLENTANGVTYNCDLVEALLKNLAVADTENLKNTGVARFIFSKDAEYFLDRRAQFEFNGDTSIYTLRLANPGGLVVHRVGVIAPTPGSNVATLTQIGPELYALDWPVEAPANEVSVIAGAAAATNYPVEGLASISALSDFSAGVVPESLATLAKKARATFYSASLTTRGGASRLLKKEFPDISAASPVLSGDTEMLRGSINALGFESGAMDLFVKSQAANTEETVIIRIPYFQTQNGSPVHAFIGKLNFPSGPIKIVKFEYTGDPTINMNPGGNKITLFSQSKAHDRATRATCCYSDIEQLWVAIDMPTDPNTGAELIAPGVEDEKQYADFRVTYRFDPLLRPVSTYAGSPDNAAAGVDTLVRGFVSLDIAVLDIRYERAPGVTVQIENARQEITAYFRTLGGPGALYCDSAVHDIMFYAGARNVREIRCQAQIRFSVGDRYIPLGGALPTTDLALALSQSIVAKKITVNSSAGFLPVYKDPDIGTPNATYEVVGDRNVAYLLDAESITFTEIR